MPMRYAHPSDVLSQLLLDEGDVGDAPKIQRVERLELGVCEAIDGELGRSFGVPVEETVLVQPRAGYELLMLPKPIRSVTGIVAGGVALAPELVALHFLTTEGALALRLVELTTWWYGTVAVTGIWADAAIDGEIPDDIREAATFLTVDEYRMRNASPTGEIGPDGQIVQVRNPWRFELVKAALQRHAVRPLRGGV